MRNLDNVMDEVLGLSNADILVLFCLVTTETAFRFSPEQWVEIGDEIGDRYPVSQQVANLLRDIILLDDNNIGDICLRIKLERNLPCPVIPPPDSIKDPVFVSKSNGMINSRVFHSRRRCSACNPADKSSFIAEVERSEVEVLMHICPICVSERNKDRKSKNV